MADQVKFVAEGGLYVPNNAANSILNTTTFDKDINVLGDLTSNGNVTLGNTTGTILVTGSLANIATDNTSFANVVTFSANVIHETNLRIKGNIVANGNITAGNTTSNLILTGAFANIATTNTSFVGAATFSNTVNVLGTLTTNNNTILGASNTGNVEVRGAVANISSDVTYFMNEVRFKANTVFDISPVFVSGQVVGGSVVPFNNTYSLGNTSSFWENLYANNIFVANGVVRISNTTDNVTITSTTFSVANSTTNTALIPGSITVGTATVNSTVYSGTANNATNFNGQPASFYANATNITTGVVNTALIANASTTVLGKVQLVDSTSNTSVTLAATAKSVSDTYTFANTKVATVSGSATAGLTTSGTTAVTVSQQAANSTANGYLSSTDWTTFNNKGQLNDTVTGNGIVDQGATANVAYYLYQQILASGAGTKVAQVSATQPLVSSANTGGATTVTLTHATSGAASGTYGDGANIVVPQVAVNVTGHVTSISNTTIRSGTTLQTGIVSLTDSVTSTSTTTAATPNSVKTTYDLAVGRVAIVSATAPLASSANSGGNTTITHNTSGVTAGLYGDSITVPYINVNSTGHLISVVNTTIRSATTGQTGVVQLTDSISSTSTTTAATPNSVKTAYDLANGKLSSITINNGTGVSGGGTGSSFTLSIGQDVGTAANVQFRSIGVGTAPSGTSGEIRAIDNITAYYSSDARLKQNIKNIENALFKINRINGVEFDWTDSYIENSGGEDGYFIRKHDVGVIAQEIRNVLPEVVAERENGMLAVKYDRIVALLIEAVKELDKKVKDLEKQLQK